MEHTDPVCGMKVDESTPYKSERGDRTIYFCAEQCKRQYDANPERYQSTEQAP